VVSQNLVLFVKSFSIRKTSPTLQFQSQFLGKIPLCTSLPQKFKIQTRQMKQITLLLQPIIEDIVQLEGIQIFMDVKDRALRNKEQRKVKDIP